MELKSCPFCGSKALYEQYAVLDGFDVPVMFCDGCKCIFAVEGFEDYVTDTNDGFTELREAWNTRWERRCDLVRIPYREYTTGYEYKCSVCGFWMTDHDSYCSECGARRM